MGIRAHARLTPAMSSYKLLVKGFIETFFAEHGMGPSNAEIAAGTGTGSESNRNQVRRAIKALAKAGLIEYWPGVPRGVRPIGGTERALELLRAHGWIVNDDDQALAPPSIDVLDFTPETGLIVAKTALPSRTATRHDGMPDERAKGGRANGKKRDRESGNAHP